MMWVFYVLIAVLMLYGAKLAPGGKWQDDNLSLASSKALLGVCAVMIVFHHVAQTIMQYPKGTFSAGAGAFEILFSRGMLFVAVFFFFSGYGLYKSLLNKPDYLKGFFRRRYVPLLIPAYAANLIFLLFTWGYGGLKGFTAKQTVGCVTGFYLLDIVEWYMVEIFILYFVFWLIFRYVRSRKAGLAIMALFIAALILFTFFRGHTAETYAEWFKGEWWCNSTPLFLIGMIFAENEEKWIIWIKKHYALCLVSGIVLCIAFSILSGFTQMKFGYWSEMIPWRKYSDIWDKLICVVTQIPYIVLFVASLLLITMKVRFSNKIMQFLGEISLELYLIHYIAIKLYVYFIPIKQPVLYTSAVLLTAIGMAVLFHAADVQIKKHILK